jgi:hypothetical protein
LHTLKAARPLKWLETATCRQALVMITYADFQSPVYSKKWLDTASITDLSDNRERKKPNASRSLNK